MRIAEGTTLRERYDVHSKIGEGGFATVFGAYDSLLKRHVAIKVLKFTNESDSAARFQREAKLLATLSHKNIVSVFAFDVLDDSTPMMVMELLTGKSLQNHLADKNSLGDEELKSIIKQCCEGLSYLHKANIVHRDLSPANIFLVGDETAITIKLLDFGLSKSPSPGQSGAIHTATGLIVGNPPYMSPEASLGEKTDERSDIYSLGCIMYECLAGARPFHADTPIGVLYKQQHEYPAEPLQRSAQNDTRRALASITLRCIQKDRKKRFQNCDELLDRINRDLESTVEPATEELDAWSSGDVTGASRNSKGSRISSHFSLSRQIVVFTCVVLACLAMAITFLALSDGGHYHLAHWSLSNNHSRGNQLKWLRDSIKMRRENKVSSADRILHDIAATCPDKYYLPTLYLDVARTAIGKGDKRTGVDASLLSLAETKNIQAPEFDLLKVRDLLSESSLLITKCGYELSTAQWQSINRIGKGVSQLPLPMPFVQLCLAAARSTHMPDNDYKLTLVQNLCDNYAELQNGNKLIQSLHQLSATATSVYGNESHYTPQEYFRTAALIAKTDVPIAKQIIGEGYKIYCEQQEDSPYSGIRILLLDAYLATKDYAKAEYVISEMRRFETSIVPDPNNPHSLDSKRAELESRIGLLKLGQNKPIEAEAHLRKAIEIDRSCFPTADQLKAGPLHVHFWSTLKELVRCLELQGKWQQCKDLLTDKGLHDDLTGLDRSFFPHFEKADEVYFALMLDEIEPKLHK